MNLAGLLSYKGKTRAAVRQGQSLGSDFGDDYIVDNGYQADSDAPMAVGALRGFDDQDSDDL